MALGGQNAIYLAKTAPKIGADIAPEVLKQPLCSALAPPWGQTGPCLKNLKLQCSLCFLLYSLCFLLYSLCFPGIPYVFYCIHCVFSCIHCVFTVFPVFYRIQCVFSCIHCVLPIFPMFPLYSLRFLPYSMFFPCIPCIFYRITIM